MKIFAFKALGPQSELILTRARKQTARRPHLC